MYWQNFIFLGLVGKGPFLMDQEFSSKEMAVLPVKALSKVLLLLLLHLSVRDSVYCGGHLHCLPLPVVRVIF